MMSGRPGREPFKFLPDESRGLPPPKLNDPRLVYTGFLGYCAGLLNNALKGRPVLKAGEGPLGREPPGGGAAGLPATPPLPRLHPASMLFGAFLTG
ncbi:NADH:ubiquinone oxidoreductase subunit C2 [Cricetulus griseus]